MKNQDQPAFPTSVWNEQDKMFHNVDGLTKRELACIKLRVPKSGDPELDAIIVEANRREIAAAVLAGSYAFPWHPAMCSSPFCTKEERVKIAVEQTNALLAELDKTKEAK